VLAAYALWIGAYLAAGHEPRDFIKLGYRFVLRSHASHVIVYDPHYHYPPNHDAPNGTGYDGQFYYYEAVDFRHARFYMDDPAYRYSRVLYPVAARVLAAGQAGAVPVTLILVNWLAIGGGTLALAVWLRRRGSSPWAAALFGIYPGLLLAVQRDLTEPLAYALVAWGIYVFDFGGRQRIVSAGLIFGLAGLARQTTLVFPLCYAAAELLRGEGGVGERARRNAAPAAAILVLGVLPFVIWTVFLWVWLGHVGTGHLFRLVPFAGLLDSGPLRLSRQPPVLLGVVIPALLCAAVAVRGLARGAHRVEPICLLVNVMLFVLLLHPLMYEHGYTEVGRVATGVVVAALLCVPFLRDRRTGTPAWLIAAGALW
jgi:hypothetical protein